METFIIKNEQGYLQKRKWRDFSRIYHYYFTQNIDEATILPIETASVWKRDLMLQDPFSTITIEPVEIELKPSTTARRLIAKIDGLFVKDLHFGLKGDFIGFKYTSSLAEAKVVYLNSPIFEMMQEKSAEFYEINYILGGQNNG